MYKTKGFKYLYLVNNDGLILTETLGMNDSSLYKVGSTLDNKDIMGVFQSGSYKIEFDETAAMISYPIKDNGVIKYVIQNSVKLLLKFQQKKIGTSTK